MYIAVYMCMQEINVACVTLQRVNGLLCCSKVFSLRMMLALAVMCITPHVLCIYFINELVVFPTIASQ